MREFGEYTLLIEDYTSFLTILIDEEGRKKEGNKDYEQYY